ncbi:peptidoglycan-binding protein [Funiculus sociatus]|uniref:peptidoglycan-binding protein n=1 Tax=Funiculus sociatus TaxID=450527 RepID=UPI003296B668
MTSSIAQYTSCSTSGVRPLDYQLIHQINRIAPGLLVDFSHLNVACGAGCHPFLQAPAVLALEKVIAVRRKKMIVNSAYRTLAQQAVLYAHYKHRRCGISVAALPGRSNHNTGLALDIEDAQGWKPYLERYGWDWIGSFDPMHFDFEGAGCKNLAWLSIKAFQQLWNYNHPERRIIEDGEWGKQTEIALLSTSCDGFYAVPGFQRLEDTSDLPTVGRSLREGSSGEDVRKIQIKLGIKPDGIFGKATTAAVVRFQRQQGLVPDGVLGMRSLQALNELK